MNLSVEFEEDRALLSSILQDLRISVTDASLAVSDIREEFEFTRESIDFIFSRRFFLAEPRIFLKLKYSNNRI